MSIDFTLLVPELVLTAVAFVVLSADLIIARSNLRQRNDLTANLAIGGLLLTLGITLATQWDSSGTISGQLLIIDRYGLLFKTIFMGTGIAVVLMSHDYVGSKIKNPGEFYALIVVTVLASILMAQSGEMLTAYIAIELLSFSLYVLVAIARGDARSAEASVKYILLGAISSAIMLYGLSLLYGVVGTTTFIGISENLGASHWPTSALGLSMFLAGFGFKLSVVPFHQWAPDVYEGAPTPVTALIAVLSKAAGIALLIRFLAEAGPRTVDEWQIPLAILAAVTITVGTLVALVQQNIKRLLAYSSIAQVGFVLVGVVSLSQAATIAVIVHLVGYAFTALAVFLVVAIVETKTGREDIPGYAGLASRAPFLAMVMAGGMFSLAGLPIFAGFVTKFYLFVAAAESGLLWLVIVAVTNSFVSLYYYLRIIRAMYVDNPSDGATGVIITPIVAKGTLWILFAGMIGVGIYPRLIADAAEGATATLRLFGG